MGEDERIPSSTYQLMYYYKATIQYDGTGYAGFQWQKDILTIQSEINQAIQKNISTKFSTVGASRTDSGVHALEQVVRITCEHPLELPQFIEQFQRMLPSQIKCLGVSPCQSDFNPSADAQTKEYRYYFTNKTEFAVNERRFISNIANPLNVDAMKACVQKINGTHDFCNFYSEGSNVKTTVRNVLLCELAVIDPRVQFSHQILFPIPTELSSCYELKIVAQGFLKQMIRHLVSALWMVGSGRLSPEDFEALLEGPRREKRLWKVAPARGLYLWRVNYSNV